MVTLLMMAFGRISPVRRRSLSAPADQDTGRQHPSYAAKAEFAGLHPSNVETECQRRKNGDLRMASQCVEQPIHGGDGLLIQIRAGWLDLS